MIEELDSNGNSVARYAHGLGIDEPLAMLRSSVTSFYQADGLGSITSLSDTTGALAATYTYDSFGHKLSATGAITNPYRFTGRELDTETGQYYNRARYYGPYMGGRFISEDPIGFQGAVDFYTYVGNSPTNYKDPFGLVQIDPTFLPSCLSNLRRAIQIVRRAAEKNPNCDCQFLRMGGRRSLQQLLYAPDITIHYDPIQQKADPESGGGTEIGHTETGNTHDIWIDPYGCKSGRWTIAANIIHELTHITLIPGAGQEDAARTAQVTCGFRLSVITPIVIVTP